MAELNIDMVVDRGRTQTRLTVGQQHNRITFHNRDATRSLTVVFDPGGVIQDFPNGDLQNDSITVAPGGSKTVKFKNAVKGATVKYTAQIGNTVKEDPIIIVD